MSAKSYSFSIRGGVANSAIAFATTGLASYGGGIVARRLHRYLVLVGGGCSLGAVGLRYLFGRIPFLLLGGFVSVLLVFELVYSTQVVIDSPTYRVFRSLCSSNKVRGGKETTPIRVLATRLWGVYVLVVVSKGHPTVCGPYALVFCLCDGFFYNGLGGLVRGGILLSVLFCVSVLPWFYAVVRVAGGW